MHRYGVYILNPIGVLIFSLVAYVYWNQLRAHLQAKDKQVSPLPDTRPNRRPESHEELPDSQQLSPPDALESLKNASDLVAGHKRVFATDHMPPQRIRIYLETGGRSPGSRPQTPTRPVHIATRRGFPTHVSPGPLQTSTIVPKSPPRTTVIEMGSPADGRPMHPTVNSKSLRDAVIVPHATKTNDPTNQDPFRLPRVLPEISSPMKRHESTGSNYFKQMMRGKKPVASISQYAQLKFHKQLEKNGQEAKNSAKKVKKHGGSSGKEKKPEQDPAKKHHKDKKQHKEKK